MSENCQKCPTCKQPLPQARAERLTRALVRALQEIANLGGTRDFVEVPAYKFRGTHSRLKYWTCLEEEDPGRRSGRWRVTPYGLRVLSGSARPPEYAVVLQDQVLHYTGRRLRWNGSDLIEAPDPLQLRVPHQDEIIAGILADG